MRRIVIVVVALAAAASSCSSASGTAGEGLHVVASFYPLAEAVQRVAGGLATVDDLTPAGVEPHDLELAPDDLEALATADLVVYLGGGFQPAVEDGVDQAEGDTLDVLDSLSDLRPAGSDEELDVDPHVWLDPERYSAIVGAVASAVERVDPPHAGRFRANAEAFRSELADLDESFADGLSSCARRTIVTTHAAFGYLADAYDLEQVPITGLSPEAEPDPARLADLKDLVEREGITTIFTEELVSPDVAETLAREAGVETAVLNPLEGLTKTEIDGGQEYVSVMRDNLEILRKALDCT